MHTLAGIDGEVAFVDCLRGLRAKDGTGAQAEKIIQVDELRLELEDASGKWSVVLDADDFSALTPLDYRGFEGALIRADIGAWPEVPAPGSGYRFVAECTVQYIGDYGSDQTEETFRRDARVASTIITAPAA